MMIRFSRFSSAGDRKAQSWKRRIGSASRIPRIRESFSSKKNGVSGSSTVSLPPGMNAWIGRTKKSVTLR
ncbi:hypothetical protein D3C83_117580 [compost metagenome]